MPDALPRLDFLQFAEAYARLAREQPFNGGLVNEAELFLVAERHARLLAQIEEWVDSFDDRMVGGDRSNGDGCFWCSAKYPDH